MYNPYQQQQQGMGYNPQQQTGYGYNNYQMPQQPQFNQQPMYPQATGFVPQQPNLYGSNFQTSGGSGMAPQQTGFSQQQTMQPQQTGYIQTQPTGFGGTAPIVTENSELKIPSIRLSFISAEDQKKFEHLFRTAVPKGEQSISGDSASGILLRSGLSAVTLAEIWNLSDIDKTGSLLFPEFALSLHLCSMAKRGEPLPGILPEKWLNEVRSFVDQINFTVPDDPSKILANTPFANFAPKKESDWLAPQSTGYLQNQLAPPMTSFQPQVTGFGGQGLVSQATGGVPMPSTTFGNAAGLTAQRTGGGTLIPLQPQQTAGLIPAQKTGPLNPQTTGFNQQSLQQQRTGGLPQQLTGYQGPPQGQGQQLQQQRTGGFPQVQSQPTGGFVPQTSFQQPQLVSQRTGPMQAQPTGSLQAQPTGRPGEWGFVSMPTGGIPGLNAMQQHFLPNNQLPTSNLHSAMDNKLKENVTWAITKQEKQIYDGLFQAWDNQKKGYVDSNVALNVFTKSGLSRSDLESIWTLVDTDDTGKLNKNQFAVAMHLIYRRLNGYDIPLRLPPELIPPADRTLKDTMDSLKNSLKGGVNNKPTKPPKPQSKPDGTRFKNDDNNFGYVSNVRHRRKSTSDESHKSSVKSSSDYDLSIEDMKKLIHEKRILLDALDTEDQANNYSRSSSSMHEKQIIENLKKEIMAVQTKLDERGNDGPSSDERNKLLATLDHLTRDVVPRLISDIHKVNQEISRKKAEVFKLELLKKNPSWNPEDDELQIQGTGPNGEVTDYDRIKYQSRQKLKQRMAALTGKSTGGNSDLDLELKQATEKAQDEASRQSEMIQDIAAGIKTMEDECAAKLSSSVTEDVGHEKWEQGKGISSEVAKFVKELEAFSKEQRRNIAKSQKQEQTREPLAKQQTNASLVSDSGAAKSAYATPEERAAYIKQQAEKRMNERLAKLGITRKSKSTEQKPPVESKSVSNHSPVPDSEVKLVTRNANEVEEQKPKPDSQPVSKNREPAEQPNSKADTNSVGSQNVVSNTNDDTSGDDDDEEEYKAILKQKQEMEARERERKLRKQKAKEERLAKIKKEMEEMKKREMEESQDEEEEEAKQVTSVHVLRAQSSNANSNVIPQQETATENVNTVSQPTSTDTAKQSYHPHESNPFSKMNNNTSQNLTVTNTGTNPFFKSTSQETKIDPHKAEAQRASQRGVASSGGWSDSEEEESEEESPNRAGAAKLASLLFGGMPQPPTTSSSSLNNDAEKVSEQEHENAKQVASTPLSNDDNGKTDSGPSGFAGENELSFSQAPPIPVDAPPAPNSIPPPPPPPPQFSNEAPPVPDSIPPPPPPPSVPSTVPALPDSMPPPPPPPPPPAAPNNTSSSQQAPGAPNIGALLGQITGGASLRKVETKVSSGATVGRVL